MSKRTKIILAIIGSIILILSIWMLSKGKKNSGTKAPAPTFPLSMNAKGDIVLSAQQQLNKVMGTPQLQEDGVLGPDTANFLKIYADYPLTEQGYNTLMQLV